MEIFLKSNITSTSSSSNRMTQYRLINYMKECYKNSNFGKKSQTIETLSPQQRIMGEINCKIFINDYLDSTTTANKYNQNNNYDRINAKTSINS
jgi:hypothetical protein